MMRDIAVKLARTAVMSIIRPAIQAAKVVYLVLIWLGDRLCDFAQVTAETIEAEVRDGGFRYSHSSGSTSASLATLFLRTFKAPTIKAATKQIAIATKKGIHGSLGWMPTNTR